jgi:urease accessory protein
MFNFQAVDVGVMKARARAQAETDETAISFAASMAPVRAHGIVKLRFKRHGAGTTLSDLGEGGGYRVKFPHSDQGCEAVIINTGGGMAGGDRLVCDMAVGAGGQVTLASQSAEKLYRCDGAHSHVDVSLVLEAGASLDWLPQESILFSGARLKRRLTAQIAQDARLLIAESVVFGRIAMGEVIEQGAFHDRWRISRAGSLVFAEDLRIDGAVASHLARPAVARGARALATILLVAPEAEASLDAVRTLIDHAGVTGGGSAWNGMLVIRAMADDPAALRGVVAAILVYLRGKPMPRVWQC